MPDPFSNYTVLARGGVPATPPQPAQPDTAPRTAQVDGIKISSDQLHHLDRIARNHRATQSGLADRLADLRSEKQDAQRRMSHLSARAAGDPRLNADTAMNAAELDAELATLAAAITEVEAELTAAAECAGAARANLKAALELARQHGLEIPHGLAGEGRNHA